jgi:hypothetical protein
MAVTPGCFEITATDFVPRDVRIFAPPRATGRLRVRAARLAGALDFARFFEDFFEPDLARAFGRDRVDFRAALEAPLFIFLGLRDLDLLAERFPAMNDSSLETSRSSLPMAA